MSNTVLVTRSWVKRRVKRSSLFSKRSRRIVIRPDLPLPSAVPHVLRYSRRLTPPVLPTYTPTEIIAHVNMEEGMRIFRYTLREPLSCRVKVSVRGWYTIECDRLDIFASGATFESAKSLFAILFDDTYYYYNEQGDDRLCPRMQEIRHEITGLIKESKEITS